MSSVGNRGLLKVWVGAGLLNICNEGIWQIIQACKPAHVKI